MRMTATMMGGVTPIPAVAAPPPPRRENRHLIGGAQWPWPGI
jgi:hypothetical protein